ncbi:phosphatase domain-containing putative toxin [Pinisolibacter sp.]|uniref:phosphatase domain-containing putative toxin n=1 Tax=Pinisolibacter sp. TaxID=2172024 RepID=UPI002FDCCE07
MANRRRASLVSVPGVAGRLHLSACPGTWEGAADRAAVRRDFARIAASGARLLVTLVEAAELPLPLADWRAEAAAAGLDLLHLPIADFGVPDVDFEAAWREVGLVERLARGETVALHCRAGLGRTGTIAARLVVEAAGFDAEAAIALVRRDHAGEAVETAAQVDYLRALSGRGSR